MNSKTCGMCNIEKLISIFYEKYTELKDFNGKRGLKRYHENKMKYQINENLL